MDAFLSFTNLQTPFFHTYVCTLQVLLVPVTVSVSVLLLGETVHTDFLFEKTCMVLSAMEDLGWNKVLFVFELPLNIKFCFRPFHGSSIDSRKVL